MNTLLAKYKKVRAFSERMCKPLEIEDYVPQPAEFVSPPKWNLGHTSWFFEEFILRKYVAGYKAYHSGYAFIFNSYYESMGNRIVRSERGDLSRPTVKEVYEYRKYIDSAMLSLLKKEQETNELVALVETGLNHEQQHQELFFSDLKYVFAANPLFPAYTNKVFVEDVEVIQAQWLKISGGVYGVGYRGNDFHYDNEQGRHKVYLHDFEIRNGIVSNAEYLEFINAGGYQQFKYWHSEGWAWVNENSIVKPMYWMEKDGEWYQYTLAGLRKLNPLNPVTHINYYEAAAFANWKNLRLPTEFEWEVACDQLDYGNRWEWTESAYLPYPGYKKPDGAVGEYNAKFMVNQKVLRGGSVVSPLGHVRKTYRNFFHPNEGWQFNGIRLAR